MQKKTCKGLGKWKVIIIYDAEKKQRVFYQLDNQQKLVNKLPICKRPRSKNGILNLLEQEKNDKQLKLHQINMPSQQNQKQTNEFIECKMCDIDKKATINNKDNYPDQNDSVNLEFNLNQNEPNDEFLFSDFDILESENN